MDAGTGEVVRKAMADGSALGGDQWGASGVAGAWASVVGEVFLGLFF